MGILFAAAIDYMATERTIAYFVVDVSRATDMVHWAGGHYQNHQTYILAFYSNVLPDLQYIRNNLSGFYLTGIRSSRASITDKNINLVKGM